MIDLVVLPSNHPDLWEKLRDAFEMGIPVRLVFAGADVTFLRSLHILPR